MSSNKSEEFDCTPIVGFESESVFVLFMVEFLISAELDLAKTSV